ncbi:hypothetical protein [Bordetella trematum]|uniref:hypothetical protein n=1 Tax=Bordetella trematum TaxID=123899 RepID=UPI003AF3A250
MFRPPLTLAELRAIQDRNPGQQDVLALLWEVKRLQSIVRRFNQLRAQFARPTDLGNVFDDLMAQLDREPCVTEISVRAQELIAKLDREDREKAEAAQKARAKRR